MAFFMVGWGGNIKLGVLRISLSKVRPTTLSLIQYYCVTSTKFLGPFSCSTFMTFGSWYQPSGRVITDSSHKIRWWCKWWWWSWRWWWSRWYWCQDLCKTFNWSSHTFTGTISVLHRVGDQRLLSMLFTEARQTINHLMLKPLEKSQCYFKRRFPWKHYQRHDWHASCVLLLI